MITVDAILLGGGTSRRFLETSANQKSLLPKQFQLLGAVPVFVHAMTSLLELQCIRQFVLVVPGNFLALAKEQVARYWTPSSSIPVLIIEGGERRQDSSRLALQHLAGLPVPPTRILIHDACRPALSSEFIERIKAAIADRSYGAWVPVVPVVETLKRVENNQVIETVDRTQFHRVQTPQVFEFSVMLALSNRLEESPELTFTDDASLCEYYGIPVGVFEGDVRNIKLTYDFELPALKNMMTGKVKDPCASDSATTSTV